MAQLGTLRLDRNTARGAYGGFWLVSLANPAQQNVIFGQFSVGDPNLFSEFASVGIAALRDGIFVIATAIGQALPAAPPSGGSPVGRQHRCAEHGPGGARRPDGHRLLLAGDRGCVRRAAATRDRRRLGEPRGARTADRTRGACGGHGHERDLAARCVRLPGRRDDRRLLFQRQASSWRTSRPTPGRLSCTATGSGAGFPMGADSPCRRGWRSLRHGECCGERGRAPGELRRRLPGGPAPELQPGAEPGDHAARRHCWTRRACCSAT